VMTFATGLADKGVSLFYELRLHETPSEYFGERCRSQILAVLAALERERAARPEKFWFGGITHADIAIACAWRHVSEAHPGLVDPAAYPALGAHSAGMEALPVFLEISQPFIAPA
jgi:glutathione S-transferase